MARVKICGNTNLIDAQLAVQLGADYLGFIFTDSKRRITPELAAEIMEGLPDFNNFVGVFFNQPRKEVEIIAEKLHLKTLQFHGEETALYCQHFLERGFEVIKTFRIKDAMSLKRLDDYDVTAYLFDTYSKEEKGGTGVPFDWDLILDTPFIHDKLFLAGGLNTTNLPEALQKVRPYAVDVASGVEKEPGIKDPALLKKFIALAKEGKSDASKSSLRS